MRLFVAVDVPDALRDAIERNVVDRLRPDVPGARWTRPDGRHLTLKFLGEVPEDGVHGVTGALRRAAQGSDPFQASFGDLGAFPNMRRPRVLWIGAALGAVEMAGLAGAVDRELAPLGFEAEKRSFTAHLTLARFKVPSPMPPEAADAIAAVRVPDGRFDVDALVLFRSQLHPKGARYSVVERLPLGGA